MRSIQTLQSFPLSSVKPLGGLLRYRDFCLEATGRALEGAALLRRDRSPVDQKPMLPAGRVGRFEYLRCAASGSLFMAELPDPKAWATLLKEVALHRHSPEAFHARLAGSRNENVYNPKREWIENTLRIQEIRRPRLLELATLPSDFTAILKEGSFFQDVNAEEEMDFAHQASGPRSLFDAAVLLESLDRVDEPAALLSAVWKALKPGGLIFVTALVSSGFDMQVLGFHSLYLCPPDRTNCFSLKGLERLLSQNRFKLLEVSTPGVLDVEIVQAHLQETPELPLSPFERQLIQSDEDTRTSFQDFLQRRGLSSFARLVGRKE